MRIFCLPQDLAPGELVVRDDEHHYLAHVRRARVGDAVELVDGAGRRAAATITRIDDRTTTLAVKTPAVIPPTLPHVRALVPLIKGDRMDSCLEKLVEVGVDSIVVWPAARSVVRIDREKRAARVAKYEAAARAAARQCGCAQVPQVQIVETLAAAIATLPGGVRIVLDPASDARLEATAAGDVTIASGPEGGLTSDEDAQLAAAGFVAAGLGPRVLRAETAPVVAVAIIRALTAT